MHIQNASQLRGVYPALFTPLLNDDPKHLRNSIRVVITACELKRRAVELEGVQ